MAVSYQAKIDLIVTGLKKIEEAERRIKGLVAESRKLKRGGAAQRGTVALASVTREQRQEERRGVKIAERKLLLQSKLNSATDLYNRKLQELTRAGGDANADLQARVSEIKQAFDAGTAGGKRNLELVRQLATELGRVVEIQRELNRTSALRSKGFEAGRRLQERLTDVAAAGAPASRVRAARSLATEAIAVSRTGDQQQYQKAIAKATDATKRLERETRTSAKALRENRRAQQKAARARTQRRESLALGAGFPLLMGGGPAQITGALIGSTFGPGFGGQILGAGIAQALQDAVALVADLQGAINELNMDKVRDSALLVNEELANQIELLKEAGGKTQAQAVLAQAVYEQFGLGAEASALIKQRADAVKNAWDRVVGTVSALIALLAQPFIAVLVPILNFVQLVARGWTEIFNVIAKIINIPGLDKLLGLQGTDEGAGQRGAEMQARARAIEKETKLLQDAFNLEKQRRIGNSLDDKLANARIDAQLKLNELRAKYSADLLNAEGAEYVALRKKQTIEENLLKLKHRQQVERMKAEDSEKRMMAAIRARSILENGQIQLAQKRLDIQNSVASAEIDAQLAVNGLLLQRANNLNDIAGQVKLQVQRADLIYRQTVLQVQQEVVKAKLARISAEVKLKELQATVALKEAKGEANAADYAAVRLQSEALKLTELGAKAAERIAASRIKGARATRQAAIEQARFNASSQLKSLNERAISRLPQSNASSLGSSRPTKAQATQNYIASMGGRQWTSIGLSRYLAAEGYAQGGFVTRPTNAMVGEGGQPEYVIPASKMNEAIRRYSAGTRGEAVVTGAGGSGGGSSTSNYSNQQNSYYGSGGGTSVNITTGPVVRMGNQNYVSVADMQRGMAAAVNAAESNMMSRMGRSYATRRSMGL